jgi:S1-C subfamily serine protease
MGTAFAIRGDGMMLTNRHVVESLTDSEIPWELGGDGEPQLTLRERYLMVCFGPDPEDQFRARIIHQSLGYDMAVLCVGRRFSNPLVLSTVPMRQGDTVYAYGYPGVVTESLTASSLTPAKMENIARKWRRTGRARIVDILTPDSFNPTLTKGIIGAPPRNIRGAAYLQTDAMIARGNSGGPALNDRYEVVGIMTLAIGGQEVGTYSFALLIDQLRDELEDALRGWPMAPKPVGP